MTQEIDYQFRAFVGLDTSIENEFDLAFAQAMQERGLPACYGKRPMTRPRLLHLLLLQSDSTALAEMEKYQGKVAQNLVEKGVIVPSVGALVDDEFTDFPFVAIRYSWTCAARLTDDLTESFDPFDYILLKTREMWLAEKITAAKAFAQEQATTLAACVKCSLRPVCTELTMQSELRTQQIDEASSFIELE